MSTPLSKNKEKRSRSSPSEANSFVKNVTSRVSGLLPATITKWFSSPSSSSANGSAPTADVSDSSSEDEGTDSPVTIQPPAKRTKYSPGSYNNVRHTNSNNVITNAESVPQYNPISSQPSRSNYRMDGNYISLRDKKEDQLSDRTERESTMYKPQNSLPSATPKRKSLFDTPTNKETSKRACIQAANDKVRDPHEPCFKPSLLGSPFYPGRTLYGGASSSYMNQPNIKQRKVPIVNESNHNDSNAISHSARRILDILENYSSPLIEAKRISQSIQGSNSDILSGTNSPQSSSRLFSYKTQELHVPTMASIMRLKQKNRLMDTTSAARQIIASHSSSSPYGSVRQFLASPSSTSTPREIDKLNVNTDKVDGQDRNAEPKKMVTKVKSSLTRPKRGDNADIETSTLPPLNLPNATLNIDQNNMPKFQFGTPAVSTAKPFAMKFSDTPVADKTEFTAVKTFEMPVSKPEPVKTNVQNNDVMFKFANPVPVTMEAKSMTSIPKFKFGSPERSIDKPNQADTIVTPKENNISVFEAKEWSCPDCWVKNKFDAEKCACCGCKKEVKKSEPAKPVEKAQPSSQSASEDWKCPDCWVSNKANVEKCVCCGCKNSSKQNAQPTKCSVCKLANSQTHVDKCVNCEKVQINNVVKPIKLAVDSSKWTCDDCWISNDGSAEKCACCGGKNPNKSAAVVPDIKKNNIGTEWQCSACSFSNSGSDYSCVSCSVARSGSLTSFTSSAAIQVPKSTDSTFGSILKTQGNKWECSNCLVRNDSDKTKCVCCETERTGAKSAENKPVFNFGVANTSFKFGIDKAAEPVANDVKPSESASSNTEKEPETNNNVIAATPNFTFGLPLKPQIENKTDVDGKLDKSSKFEFTFGVPKKEESLPASSVATSMFTLKPPEPAKTQTEEKPQEVPKVDLSFPPKEVLKLPSGPSSTPLVLDSTPAKPVVGIPSLVTSVSSVKSPVTTAAATLSVAPAATLSFSFTAPAAKPATTLFASPITTAAATLTASSNAPIPSIFTSPIQATSASTSLFPKTDTTVAPTPSLFGAKTDTSTSLFPKLDKSSTVAAPAPAAAAPASSAAPLFSFGSNVQEVKTQAAPEKPKFNFSFGSNTKTDTPSFTFGGNTANNANDTSSNFQFGGFGAKATPSTVPSEVKSTEPIWGGSFGQKKPAWPMTNSAPTENLFASSNPAQAAQKPAPFSFGASTFNSTPAVAPASTPFGVQPTPQTNMFEMGAGTNSASLFPSPAAPATFGATLRPAATMFGSPSATSAPTFGAPNPTIFEAPAPAPTATFNFGQPQPPAPGVFGFGQQTPAAPPQAGVYNFGGAPQVQFNMGSAPNARRVRKAVRRNPTR